MKKYIAYAAVAITLAIAAFLIYQKSSEPPPYEYVMDYSDFIGKVKKKQIKKVEIAGQYISLRDASGETATTFNPNDPYLMETLLNAGVRIKTIPPPHPSLIMEIFISWFPMLLILAFMVFMYRKQSQGASGNKFSKSNAKLMEENTVLTTFDDVAGCEEAKEDVVELVDFLREPEKFQRLGGKIPKGILMVGPPGTGKTLLARAIAGEAKVKFFSTCGSDFVEMFVGVGASRVRDMFEQARKNAPCIVFIDEIDAVGRQRSQGGMGGGGQDESEQTLNQLLVEMDGFEGTEGIIVIAATNRADILDKALLRPGRFDRQVTVGLPDIKGREQILNVHMKKVPAASDVMLRDIARGTPGFSGADLANLINEAAILAARSDKTEVSMADLEKAKDKILMGAERRTMVMSEENKRLTAYHEAGHCIVGELSEGHNPVYKVSIMPRSNALGITMFLPEQDQHSVNKKELESQIAALLGGRIAEDIIYGDEMVTTGASSDIERATDLARNMVTRWGLSKRLGPMAYGDNGTATYGRRSQDRISVNNEHLIDEEMRAVIDRNYARAEAILYENVSILHNMAEALIHFETIDKAQIDALMSGKDLCGLVKKDKDRANKWLNFFAVAA